MNPGSATLTIDRRTFLRAAATAAGTACLGTASAAVVEREPWLRRAMFYEQGEQKRVECRLCPRGCVVGDGERGYCRVRENRGGDYYTLVFARPCALHADPIEKKPLFHCLPRSKALSLATAGCNMACKFCQNWNISQAKPEDLDGRRFEDVDVSPAGLARLAKRTGSATLAFTYSEPTIFYEYMYESAKAAKREGVGAVMISNGFMEKEPLEQLCKELTAVKVDLKAFTDGFYRRTCDGRLQPVLDTLERLKKIGIWFEIVVLLIPTLNDGDAELKGMCAWIAKTLGPDVPVHFTSFHPTYKLRTLPRTPVRTLERAHAIGRAAGLRYVYVGNVPGHKHENTYCPKCGKAVVKRVGFRVTEVMLLKGKCAYCDAPVAGLWERK